MRKVLDNNQQVAHFFANNIQCEGRASNFYFENDRLFSYGGHFCIARRLPSGLFAFTTRRYGQSTSKHLSYARSALCHKTLVWCNDPSDSAATNMRHAQSEINTTMAKSEAPRIRQTTRDGLKASALRLAENANAYLAALPEDERGNCTPFDVSGLDELRAAMLRIEAAEKQLAEDARIARANMQRDALAEWLAGGANRGGMYALPVALRLGKSSGSHHTGGLLPDAGSVGHDVIQTSHGAEIPVSHGVALWPVVQSVVQGERTPDEAEKLVRRLGVYSLSTIRKDGSIVVGCHDIAYSELKRMAVVLGLPEMAAA